MTLPGAVIDPNPPATLTEALARPTASPIFLAEVTCGRYEPAWVPYGFDATYYVFQGDEVVRVTHNGSNLTQQASRAATQANPGSFYWDTDGELCYIHLADGSDPSDPANTIETFLLYRFSDAPTDIGGYLWDQRLLGLPGLSTRIPDSFNGTVQVGGGRMDFNNLDHFFDQDFNTMGNLIVPGRIGQNWDAGKTVLKMGAAGLPWNEFQTLATFFNAAHSYNEKRFSLELKERKTLLDRPFPLRLYTADEFPRIRAQDVGRAQQYAFGNIYGVNPVCVDTEAREFRVADHPIVTFNGCRVRNAETGLWEDVNFLSVDEPNALFTLDSADWSDGQDIVVDFSGWSRDNGKLADNPMEQIRAMVEALGESVDEDAYEEARSWYDLGYRHHDATNRITIRRTSLYLDTQGNGLESIQKLLQNARAYLLVTAEGLFELKVFRNYQASGLELVQDELDTLGEGLKREAASTSTGTKVTKASVYYRIRGAEGIRSVYTHEATPQQYKRDLRQPSIVTFESLFADVDSAKYLAECLVNEHRVDQAIYSCTMKWRPFQWRVGQHLHVISERHGLDQVLEILECSINLTKREVGLRLGNLRGFEESSGFWTQESDQTPSGEELDWVAQTLGQAIDPENQYRRHQTGIWHNDNNQAQDPNPGSGLYVTAYDHSVSRWQ